MSFRKRNIGISRTQQTLGTEIEESSAAPTQLPGVRPSPIDGRPTTSTGTPTLDALLAGHAGLALGSSLLIEESGTTDYASTLLRYYAAEGIIQRHKVHVVGVGEQWGRELPGLVGPADGTVTDTKENKEKDKMKIAWRYERLGEFGASTAGSGSRAPTLNRAPTPTDSTTPSQPSQPFAHIFDLTKRLTIPTSNPINHIPIPTTPSNKSPYDPIVRNLQNSLITHPNIPHRLLLPSLLSPLLYPPSSPLPHHLLPFLHSLRALLRLHPNLTIVLSVPLSLYPRSSALVRWIELLVDGVLELSPFPYSHTASGGPKDEEQPQGLLRVWKLPVWEERGGGGWAGGWAGGGDWAFVVGRKRFEIKAWSLPPVEGDTEAQEAAGGAGGSGGKGLEF
ncbi:PAXNEB-domain-containing protein [Patellaria atrata CBS 101060]|uniref:Elongator complex protein 4 n=1 Tax=Patellaria atrata CBS 101060 TaxID=1346257 RepID=A0A9P4SBS0_9PEZI|nr:PAXNEB-domain-containing protein [Patellaria atrata CBS 101060]